MLDYLIFALILLLKIFLFKTTQSTDFEVHRNWKAITNSLPISEWYFYSKNKWSLDYPPLFAYMEYILGKVSISFDKNITNLEKEYYVSTNSKIFMRSTVLLGDFLLFFSLKRFCRIIKLSYHRFLILIFAIIFNAGLVLVDSIHFQYNSLLYGIFFISLGYIAKKQYALAAVFYTICLCMKHIFIYFAPAYFIFYLHYIVINKIKKKKFKKLIINLVSIGLGILSVLIITFLPFIIISIKTKSLSQFIQIKERLFPLNRGLLHTYWAPNIWALYSLIDKILYYSYTNYSKQFSIIDKVCSFFLKYKDYNYKRNTSSTGAGENGVSKPTGFDILPDINMKITNIIICTFLVIYFMQYYRKKSREKIVKIKNQNNARKIKEFIQHCIYSNFIFFNFGFQVHEKAFLNISIMVLLDYIISVYSVELKDKKIYTYSDDITSLALFITLIGTNAQMPLIQDPRDYLVKIGLVSFYFIFCKVAIFNKNDFNTDTATKIVVPIVFFLNLIGDFFVSFEDDFNLNLDIPGMLSLKQIVIIYPFMIIMGYSCLNSVFVQVIFLLLFT